MDPRTALPLASALTHFLAGGGTGWAVSIIFFTSFSAEEGSLALGLAVAGRGSSIARSWTARVHLPAGTVRAGASGSSGAVRATRKT